MTDILTVEVKRILGVVETAMTALSDMVFFERDVGHTSRGLSGGGTRIVQGFTVSQGYFVVRCSVTVVCTREIRWSFQIIEPGGLKSPAEHSKWALFSVQVADVLGRVSAEMGWV